jgi:hypothetical protein
MDASSVHHSAGSMVVQTVLRSVVLMVVPMAEHSDKMTADHLED